MVKRCKHCGREIQILAKGVSQNYGFSIYGRNVKCRCKTPKHVSSIYILIVLSLAPIIISIIKAAVAISRIPEEWVERQLYKASLTSSLELSSLLLAVGFFLLIITISFEFYLASKRKKLVDEIPLNVSCLYCKTKFDEKEIKDIVSCMNCGKKASICPICNDSVFYEDNVYQVKPCNHVFHKLCMYEWLLGNNKCPSCEEEIKEIDIDLSDLYKSK